MRTVFLCAVMAGLGLGGWFVEQTCGAEAVIVKVFHEQRPMKTPPRLMSEMVDTSSVNWDVIVSRDPRQEPGEYFLIVWKYFTGATTDLKLRFEYRQERTQGIQVVVLPVQGGGSRLTPVAIKGDAFLRGGAVTAWRISILDGTKTLASRQSFMW